MLGSGFGGGDAAAVEAEDLNLAVIASPIKLPKVEISQYWRERSHREPGNQWICSIFGRLFRVSSAQLQLK